MRLSKAAQAGLGLALLVVTGPAVSGAATPPPGPTASINFVKDFHSPADDLQFLDAVRDEVCSKGRRGSRRLGTQNNVTNSRKPIIVPAGQRIFLRSTGTYTAYGPDLILYQERRQHRCFNITSFVPEPGHTYTLSQRNQVTSCEVKLRDNATGKAPETMLRHEVTDACRYNG